MSGSGGRSPWLWVGAACLVVAAVAVVVLDRGAPTGDPFDTRSSAPDGYRALALLLRDRGATVGAASAAAAADRDFGPGDVLVVPAPELASDGERRAFRAAAEAGATVVLAGGGAVDVFGLSSLDPRLLADTPAQPVRPERCDIPQLADLGPIDGLFAEPLAVDGERSCYGGPDTALVRSEAVGEGTVVELADPYLLANARLQPAKEEGGEPLDNAALALRLFGPAPDGATAGVGITFVDARPSAGVEVPGQTSIGGLLARLPLGVRLALAQGAAAFVLYAWWKARRLGRPVRERRPVEIAGSELVAAVGDLLRRRGSAARAAEVLRSDARRELGRRLGVPPTVPVAGLASVVAGRCGRDPAEVAAALGDAPVRTTEELVRLARTIDAVRQEVLHEPVAG